MESDSKENLEKARKLFERGRYEEVFPMYHALAEAGSVEAQLLIGWMYYTGHGVKEDIDQAFQWYHKAADSKSAAGQYFLGTIHRAKKDYQQALQCFEESAAQDYVPAFYQLGQAYEYGEGVNVQRTKSLEYYQVAAIKGHLMARRVIALMTIKGEFGLKRIPLGLLEFVRVLITGFQVSWSSPYDDRLRWE